MATVGLNTRPGASEEGAEESNAPRSVCTYDGSSGNRCDSILSGVSASKRKEEERVVTTGAREVWGIISGEIDEVKLKVRRIGREREPVANAPVKKGALDSVLSTAYVIDLPPTARLHGPRPLRRSITVSLGPGQESIRIGGGPIVGFAYTTGTS